MQSEGLKSNTNLFSSPRLSRQNSGGGLVNACSKRGGEQCLSRAVSGIHNQLRMTQEKLDDNGVLVRYGDMGGATTFRVLQ